MTMPVSGAKMLENEPTQQRELSFSILCEGVRIGAMKQHRFWAMAALFCFAMLFYTGYRHK
ncbi:MAG: hypothetical protein LIO54_02230 [Oscillospiraceae bacterium]|nr:hypothetical protein [Oscillospiraceae bacterium]